MKDPIVVAQELYDRPGDLVQHEQEFLTAVHQATMECARIKKEAICEFGDGSRTALAVAFTADVRCKAKLANALELYTGHYEGIES